MKLPTQHELLSKTRLWSKRRLILLASVAAVGAGVMLASPAYPPVTLNGTPAHAAWPIPRWRRSRRPALPT